MLCLFVQLVRDVVCVTERLGTIAYVTEVDPTCALQAWGGLVPFHDLEFLEYFYKIRKCSIPEVKCILVRVSYRILSLGGGGGEERCYVWNRLSDENLTHLMRNVIEGPDLNEFNFNEILDIFKEKNRRITL